MTVLCLPLICLFGAQIVLFFRDFQSQLEYNSEFLSFALRLQRIHIKIFESIIMGEFYLLYCATLISFNIGFIIILST